MNTAAGPLSYAFSFNTPLVANLLGPVESHAELGVTLTDGFNHGATVQPATPGGKMLTSFDLDVTGVPVSKNVDIGDLFSMLSGTSGTTFSKDGSPVCHQACATMSVLLAFPLIGEGSVAFSGKVVQAVPVPASLFLFASGLGGFVLCRLRRPLVCSNQSDRLRRAALSASRL